MEVAYIFERRNPMLNCHLAAKQQATIWPILAAISKMHHVVAIHCFTRLLLLLVRSFASAADIRTTSHVCVLARCLSSAGCCFTCLASSSSAAAASAALAALAKSMTSSGRLTARRAQTGEERQRRGKRGIMGEAGERGSGPPPKDT